MWAGLSRGQMLNHVAAGPFGLGQRSKGRSANLDRDLVVVKRTPTRQVAGASDLKHYYILN